MLITQCSDILSSAGLHLDTTIGRLAMESLYAPGAYRLSIARRGPSWI